MKLDHHLGFGHRGAGHPGHGIAEAARAARELEALGFDGGFTAEANHEPFFPLLLAAEHTERIELFTNIAVAFARSPMDLAQIANDLQLASKGRFILGLGSQIRPHIEKRFSMTWERPVTRMREIVEAIKAIHRTWNEGVPLAFRGQLYRHTLMTPFFDPGPNPFGSPPVYVAALGPQMTAVAAEVADGLLVHPFHSGRFVLERVLPIVERGLASSGRTREQFAVSVTPIVCTGDTSEELDHARAEVKALLGFYGSTPAYRVTLDLHGWGELQDELNRLTKEGRWAELADAVPEEVFDELVVSGAPDEIGRLVSKRYAGAVDRVGLSMPYDASTETLGRVVAGFRSLTR